jgi:ABC-2 type transport system permease protein
MSKILRVIRQELFSTFQRKTYVVIAFGIPVLAVILMAGIQLVQSRSPGGEETPTAAPVEFQMEVEGYVDRSGLIRAIPENLPEGCLIPYESEEQAQQALAAGEITAYYVIPPDYVEKGEVFYVYPEIKALISDGQEWVMQWTMMFNLLGGEEETADRVWNPIWNLEWTSIASQSQPGSSSGEDCSRPGFACQSNGLVRYLPSILVGLFYVSFMASSSMLFNSIGAEKENRTIEVLLLSIHPRQLLAGKTIGLGIAGLLQTAAWLGAIFLAFEIGGQSFSLPENFTFPASILAWSLVFFLGGYALYASLMAGAGALVPKMKEASAASFIAMIPLFAGYIVGLLAPIAGVTDEPLPVALSLFPLTAPVVMVMRLTDSVVPLWQILLSAALTYLTAYFTLRGAASLFRAQNLLSGQSFSIGRYLRAFLMRP